MKSGQIMRPLPKSPRGGDASPLVSIITPNYNYSHFITQTIESVLRQDYPSIEHLIIDDGSTDNSIEVVQKYVNEYPGRIRLITQANRGQTAAINVGLREARGQVIGWINSDDFYCDGAVAHMMSAFQGNPLVDIVFGDYLIVDESGDIIREVRQLEVDYLAAAYLGFGPLVCSNTVFWKASLTKAVGLLKEDFIYNMDGEYWSRLLTRGKSLHIQEQIAAFRWHSSAKTVQNKRETTERYKFELEYERRQSYQNLWMAHVLPYEASRALKVLFVAKRILQRFVRGHYFLKRGTLR